MWRVCYAQHMDKEEQLFYFRSRENAVAKCWELYNKYKEWYQEIPSDFNFEECFFDSYSSSSITLWQIKFED